VTQVFSMAPVLGPAPTVLILGSMPGVASLTEQQYYAHPRNLFWPMLAEILQQPLPATFAERYLWLQQNGIALWDVLASCERAGSLDSAIKLKSAVCNPIDQWLQQQPQLGRICCNGATAAKLFRQYFPELANKMAVYALPSTSPAHASVSRQHKLQLWANALRPLNPI